MYWPTTTAKRLHISPAGLDKLIGERSNHNRNGKADEEAHSPEASSSSSTQNIVHIARSRNGHLWAAISADTLSIWNSRPTQVVAALVRTPISLVEYGQNIRVQWTEDGLGLVIETDQSFLLLYNVVVLPEKESQIYSYIPSNGSGAKSRVTNESLAPSIASLKSSFASGAGEGTGAMAGELKGVDGGGTQTPGEGKQAGLDIRFKLVLRIDAQLACTATTREHLIVATKSPPAIQCIPWPERNSSQGGVQTRTSLMDRLDWLLAAQVDDEEEKTEAVYAKQILHSRAMDMYVWLTSDGRAYCASLEMDSRVSDLHDAMTGSDLIFHYLS